MLAIDFIWVTNKTTIDEFVLKYKLTEEGILCHASSFEGALLPNLMSLKETSWVSLYLLFIGQTWGGSTQRNLE